MLFAFSGGLVEINKVLFLTIISEGEEFHDGRF
jgi:hypothetical protein